MTALVVFDIEAVPDLEAGRRLLGQPDIRPTPTYGGCWESVLARWSGSRDSVPQGSDVPDVSIAPSMPTRGWRRSLDGDPNRQPFVGEKNRSGTAARLCQKSSGRWSGTGPVLVTFGGNGFDLPLLRYRAFGLGVPYRAFTPAVTATIGTLGSDHVDLCDVLSGYGGSSKPSLAEMAALANIPVKIGGVDGSQVEAYVEAAGSPK